MLINADVAINGFLCGFLDLVKQILQIETPFVWENARHPAN